MPVNERSGSDLTSTSEEAKPSSKVARLIDAYDFGAAYGDWLEERWTADGDERKSLRSLAEEFNIRLLETTMADSGMTMLDGEVKNLYRLLTDDEVSSGDQAEARRRLEQNSVDVDKLEQDFITYQAIRSYLKNYRGAEYDSNRAGRDVDSVIDSLQQLQSRVRSVTENSLSQLRKTDQLTLGKFQLFIEFNVLCTECNSQHGVIELLKRGGCHCKDKSNGG